MQIEREGASAGFASGVRKIDDRCYIGTAYSRARLHHVQVVRFLRRRLARRRGGFDTGRISPPLPMPSVAKSLKCCCRDEFESLKFVG